MNQENDLNIELFFEDPKTPPRPRPTSYGVLYLLRRDINTCFDNNAEWPGIMATLAGIDLLGKFYKGDEIGVGDRFRLFLDYFGNISEEEKEIIYQLRNSLLHSFGLYSEDRRGNIYRFTLGKNFPQFIEQNGERYYVDVLKLLEYFNLSIGNYYSALKNSTILQAKFEEMFPKYGAIHMT